MKFFLLILLSTCIIACQVRSKLENTTDSEFSDLPVTDGNGLRPKPAPLSKEQKDTLFEIGKNSCATDCVTEFGSLLGTTDLTPSYSNCQSSCIRPEYSFLNLNDKSVSNYSSDPENSSEHYIGVIYQCVEYARRWWMINEGITFGSIDSAHEIIYLNQAKNIYNNTSIPLARSINGTAANPPKRGDLVIYYPQENNPDWLFGHVAVVVDVDLAMGIVSLAEENYNNQRWVNPHKYARQIQLKESQGNYQLLDIAPNGDAYNGGEISGWVYPLSR